MVFGSVDDIIQTIYCFVVSPGCWSWRPPTSATRWWVACRFHCCRSGSRGLIVTFW